MATSPRTHLRADPRTPGVLLVAQVDGGAWVASRVTFLGSSDGGVTWPRRVDVELTEGGYLSGLGAGGDLLYAVVSQALYRSDDRGISWTLIATGEQYQAPSEILGVEPSTGSSLLISNWTPALGATGYVDLVTKGGGWSSIPTPVVAKGGAVDWNASDSMVPLKTLHIFGAGLGTLYSKSSEGSAWTQGPNFTLSVAAANGKAIAAAEARLMYSANAGQTWQIVKVGEADFQAGAVAYAPTQPAIAYAVERAKSGPTAPCRVARSADGGATWVLVGAVACEPHSMTLEVEAGDGNAVALLVLGPYVSHLWSSRDGGRTWQVMPRSGGMPNGAIRSVIFDAADPASRWLRRSNPEGIADRTMDAGATWQNVTPVGGWVPQIVGASRWTGNTIFATGTCSLGIGQPTSLEIVRSVDGGDTWTPAAPEFCALVESISMVEGDAESEIFYASLADVPGGFGVRNLILRSLDDGVTWAPVTAPAYHAQAFARAAASPMVLYLGTVSTEGYGLLRSSDRGATWLPMQLSPYRAAVSAIAVDPRNQKRIFVGAAFTDAPSLLRSDNAGIAWTSAWDAMPTARIEAIAFDPLVPERIYVAAPDVGVFRSDDDGATWLLAADGLGDNRVRALEFDPHDPTKLHASTDTGPYVLDVSGVPAEGIRLAVEYHHATFDHYFVSADADEVAALDGGMFEGWSRTGESFNVAPAASSGLAPVCRFFGVGFAPLSSHFYTPYPAECDIVKADPKWIYEKIAFGLALPESASHGCPPETRPLYRLWNANRDGAPNHRYTTSMATFEFMRNQEWIFEGEKETRVFACVPD
jgi:hypothetical protein